jgi:hypothetical protein
MIPALVVNLIETLFTYFCHNGVRTQGLPLARQAVCHLSHASNSSTGTLESFSGASERKKKLLAQVNNNQFIKQYRIYSKEAKQSRTHSNDFALLFRQ